MNNRIIIFTFSFSLVFMGLMLLQQGKKPKDPAADQVEQIADLDGNEEANDSDPADADGQAGADNSDGADDPDSDQELEQDADEIKAAAVEQFPMLGSLDAADNTRFLVTFTTRGGAIKKIESNIRKKRKNRLAYRDLEYKLSLIHI